jgi:hypothetical protein
MSDNDNPYEPPQTELKPTTSSGGPEQMDRQAATISLFVLLVYVAVILIAIFILLA